MKIFLVDYENTGRAGLLGIEALGQKDEVDIFWGAITKSIPFDLCMEMLDTKASVNSHKGGKVAKNYLDFQIATFLGFVIGKYNQSELFIVSRDKDYESVVDFWREKGYEIVCCCSISEGCTKRHAEKSESIQMINRQDIQEDIRQVTGHDPVISKDKGTGNKQRTNKKKTRVRKDGQKKQGKRLKKEWRTKFAAKMKSVGIKEDCYGKVFYIVKRSKDVGEYQRKLKKSFSGDKGTAVYTATKGTFIEYLKR